MLMRVMLQSTTQRDPVEQGKALIEYVDVEADSGNEAAAKAGRPGWLVRHIEPAPVQSKAEQVEAPAKRGRKAA